MADKKNINSTIHYISNPKHKGRGFLMIEIFIKNKKML